MSAGIVNDFKSMEGDRRFGLESIPLLVGIDKAKWLAALIPDSVQLGVAAYFYSIGEATTAAAVAALVLPQIYFQSTLLFPDPVANDIKYVTMSQVRPGNIGSIQLVSTFLIFCLLLQALFGVEPRGVSSVHWSARVATLRFQSGPFSNTVNAICPFHQK